MVNEHTWTFTPFNLKVWNESNKRVLFVAAEPNGEKPNGGADMGEWFRTANELNKWYNNKPFYRRCEIILEGIFGESSNENFNHFRFVDLKSDAGGAVAHKNEMLDYLKDESNFNKVLQYFISNDPTLGLAPNIIVILGGHAQDIFKNYIKPELVILSPEVRYVFMTHPSARTVSYEYLSKYSEEINERLVPITLTANRLSGKSGWIEVNSP
jgi:hypothetical protein